MKLSDATRIAQVIHGAIAEYCERIEIAGSIRRQRPWCNDIDIVCLPRAGQANALRERCKANAAVVSEGPQTLIVRLRDGTQLDLWQAAPASADMFSSTPGNFGSLLLCRTGSREHNIWLIERAKRAGLRWNPHSGVYDGHGHCLGSETEEDIFKVLGLEYISPEKRERP